MTFTKRYHKLAKEYREKLRQWQPDQCGDEEVAHLEADGVICQLLVELGFEDVVEEYHKVNKWYA